jgi:hypothetical protein
LQTELKHTEQVNDPLRCCSAAQLALGVMPHLEKRDSITTGWLRLTGIGKVSWKRLVTYSITRVFTRIGETGTTQEIINLMKESA